MVLTDNQTIAFYEDKDQISLPQATRLQLVSEGLENVHDLLEFDGESIKGISNNLRQTGGRISNPGLNADPGDMILTPSFSFGEKIQMRLKAETTILRYYETVWREITAPNMRWTTTIKSFVGPWKAVEEQKKEDDVTNVPKITEYLAVTKLMEAFADFLAYVMGRRNVTSYYVSRQNDVVPVIAPPLAAIVGWVFNPYLTEYVSV